jgi:hypothetical protein
MSSKQTVLLSGNKKTLHREKNKTSSQAAHLTFLKSLKLGLIVLFWMLLSYMVFSALWGNTESTVGQRGNAVLFLINVFWYLFLFPLHSGGLLFDLPFSFFIRPGDVFYLFGAEIVLVSLIAYFSSLRKAVLKYAIAVLCAAGLFALIINLTTIRPCVTANQYCLWWRIYTPMLVGIYGTIFCTVYPAAAAVDDPRLRFKKNLLKGAGSIGLFILVYFISIYIPWEQNAKFARSYSLELMRSYQP